MGTRRNDNFFPHFPCSALSLIACPEVLLLLAWERGGLTLVASPSPRLHSTVIPACSHVPQQHVAAEQAPDLL